MRYTTANAKFGFGRHTFCEFPTWLDGSPLSDSRNANKFDDVLFKKKTINGKPVYYKRYIEAQPSQHQAEMCYSVRDWGVDPANDGGTNHKRFQGIINYVPQGYSLPLFVPGGRYNISRFLMFDGKPFHICGVHGGITHPGGTIGSRLIFPGDTTGIYFDRKASNHQDAIIKDIAVEASGNQSVPWCSGINARARVRIIRCSAKNFSHNGIDIWANLEGEGTDASQSQVINCEAAENGNCGFFAGRMDASMITFQSCDARDNGKYGFFDDSFLGNRWRDCMAHYNGMKAAPGQGGDFAIRDWQNARAIFDGCYTEEGNPNPSQLGYKSRVIGGMWGTGYRIMDEPFLRYHDFIPTM